MRFSLFASTVLGLVCLCPALIAQENVVADAELQPAQLSEAEAREKATVDRFWNLLQRAPRRGTSLDRVYGYYVDTGQIDKLIEQCTALTEEKPDDAKAWLLLGLVLSRRNDDEGTIAAFEKAETLDPNDALSSFYLGESLIAQGRLRDAAAALERSVERKPQRNDVLIVMQTLGRVYERFGDKEKAGDLWSRLEEMFPNDLDIIVRIAETLEEESKYDDALTRYQKLAELAREKKDNYARVRFTLSAADIKIRLGNKQEAVNDFDALLEELAGDNWLADSVRDRVERVFVRQADYAGLAGYYQKRLQSHPNDVETTRRLAVALVRLGRTDEAKTLLENTLEKAPSNIVLRLGLIDLLVNDRLFDRVDEEYAKIDELDPNNPDHISQWGLAVLENRKLTEQQRKDAAAKIWLKLVDARPNDQAMLVMTADLMAGAKINDEAEKLYLRAVELSPNDPSYREYLGFFYHRSEQKDKAVETLKQIAEGNRRTTANLAMLANIFKSLGYADESLEAMQAAAESAPRNFDVQLNYADMLLQNEDYDDAKTQLAKSETLVESDEERQAWSRVEIELLVINDELKAAIETLAEQLGQSTADAKQLWRLAMYYRADGAMVDATETIEKALALEPGSLMLLDAAADIYTKAYDEQRAADIYEKLASVDTARRVDHLKKLANLQRDMGQIDKAIDTARLVMATGSGNVANSRFYADMLIGIGRRRDGIEALRRAVRIDPTDQVSLAALAEQLAQDGQLDEAIEINWRIFDRTEDLQGKIGQIGKLSNYYQQGNRFDQLIARLRQNTSEPDKRREAAYCLAQAHASVGDYFAARNALEMLLTNVDEEKSSDTFLLDQLSRVAEMQGDFASAIRYQEMLCDQTSLAQDRDRLLGLYYAAGERDKASNVYLQMVSGNAEFADQVSVLDKLLAREDYAVAQTLIERLEMKYPDNWELMYRKMQATYWLRNANGDAQTGDELAETYAQLTVMAHTIRKLENADDELSVVEQKAKNAALQKKGGIQAQGGAARPYANMGSNYAPWGFGQHHGYDHSYFDPGTPSVLATWNKRNGELVQTLFRERLQLEQHYYNRGSMMSTASPEKPLFKPMTFGDVKFAALAWEMKFAHDQDTADFLRDFPEEAELLKELPEEEITGRQSIAPVAVGGVLPSASMSTAIPAESNDEDDPDKVAQKEEAAKNRERVEKALKFERLFALIETVEKELPAESDDNAALLERLRFEMFRSQLITSIAVDEEILMPLPWLKEINNNVVSNIMHGGGSQDSVLGAIMIKLGMKGEKEWKQAAFRNILNKVTLQRNLSIHKSFDIDGAISEIVADIEDETQRAEMAGKIKQKMEEMNAESYRQVKPETFDDGFADNDARLDWLVEALLETATEDPKQLTTRIHHHSNIISQLPQVYQLLEFHDRKIDMAKLDAMLDRLAEQEPQFYMLRIQMAQSRAFDPDAFHAAIFGQLVQIRHQLETKGVIEEVDITATPELPEHLQTIFDKHAKKNASKEPSDEWKHWVIKMKDAIIKDIDRHSRPQINQAMGHYTPSTVEAIQQAIVQRIHNANTGLMNVFGVQQWHNAQSQNMIGYSYRSMGAVAYPMLMRHGVYGTPQPVQQESEKKKISPENLETIAQSLDRNFELADFQFEILGEIQAAQKAVEKQPARTPARTPARQRTQSLSQYRYYFQGNNSVSGHEVRSLMQNPTQNSSMGTLGGAMYVQHVQPDNTLLQIYQQCLTLDYLLESSEPGEGVTAEQLRMDCVERFKTWLDQKAESDRESVADAAKTFRDLLKNIDGQQSEIAAEQENDLDKMLAELEAEYKQAEENNVDMPSNRLLAMSLIYSAQKKFARVMECLDRITFPSASDVKMRETIALQLYQQGGDEQEKIKPRAEQAIDRLLGYQLNPEELRTVRAALQQFDRKEEADAIRDRLLLTATDANTMGNLLQELRGQDAKGEQTVQFALKVFRSPAFSTGRVFQQNSWEKHVRDQAIDILQQAGKLEEIVEQIEAQWKSSPGSFDIMTSLAAIYVKADRKDDAEKIIEQMKSQIPDDAQKMMNFANLLRSFERKEDAAEWMNKALAKNPALILQNYWEYMRFYSDIGQEKQLIEFLKGIDKKLLMQQSHSFSYLMRELMQKDTTKDEARKLFDEFWEAKDLSDNERQNLRQSLIQGMIWNPEAEFYPYFKEVVLEAVSPVEAEKPQASRRNVRQQTVYHLRNIHNVYSWSNDDARSLSGSFLDLAKNANKLNELREQVGEIVAKHEAVEESKRDWERFCNAKILQALLLMKTEKFEESVDIIEELQKNPKTSQYFTSSQCETTLAMGLEKSNEPRAIEMAIGFYEKSSQNHRGGMVEQFYNSRLVLLYLKSKDREKGIEKALASLRQNLRYLKLCGNNSYVQVGNNHYGIHELAQSIQKTGTALKDAGCGIELLQIYRTQCEGQTWYTTLMNNNNWRHYTDQIKSVFDSVLDNTSVDGIVANIEMFVPLATPVEKTDDDATKEEETAAAPLFLGVYRSPVEQAELPVDKEKLADSEITTVYACKLFDALRHIAKTDAEKFASVCDALAKLQIEHPDDATVLMTNAWCKMLAGESAENLSAQLQLFVDWIGKRESAENVSDQILLAAWVLAREVYANSETYSRERFGEQCEKLAVFSCRYMGRKLESAGTRPSVDGETRWLSDEFRLFAPVELQDQLKAVVSVESLKSTLMPNGQLVPNLNDCFYDIKAQYLAAVGSGNTQAVMGVFESLFANGWPGLGDRTRTDFNSMEAGRVFVILNAVIDAATQSGNDEGKAVLFDLLTKIVLAPESDKPVFFAMNNSLGGRNGYYRSPAIVLADLAVQLHRENELQTIIDDKRERLADQTQQRQLLDAMELALALRTNDAEQIDKYVQAFLKLVRDERNTEAGRIAIVAVADQGIRAETLELFDAALMLSQQRPPRYAHFAFHLLRKNMMPLIESGDIDLAVKWTEHYREICRDANLLEEHDGTRTGIDDRLLVEFERCLENDQPETAVKILKYFAAEPSGSHRYRDLGRHIDLLKARLETLDEGQRKQLLGDLQPDDIARESGVPFDAEAGRPKVAKTFDLPELPSGTLVYENDFEESVGERWSTFKREITSRGGRRGFLGEFHNEPVTFRLDKLEEHKMLRIKFDLYTLDGMDGLVGAPRHFGVDTWQMKLDNGLVPLGASFSNYHKDPNNQKQSYPDDYPVLFGRKPGWLHRVENDSLWDDNLETGFYYGRHGAVEENAVSPRKSAVYAVDMIVPHDGETLEILFGADFRDGPYENALYHLSIGECWGLDNFRVETINEPWSMTEEETARCFEALIGNDGLKANAARWRLVAAGDQSTEYIRQWFAAEENAEKAKQFQSRNNFLGFRIWRVLQLIDTENAAALRTLFDR